MFSSGMNILIRYRPVRVLVYKDHNPPYSLPVLNNSAEGTINNNHHNI